MQEQLKDWTLNKLQENPKLFGGDDGNSAIILEYLKDMSPHDKVTLITHETVSNSVSVSRIKNKLLCDYPEFDYRVKNTLKPRQQFNQGQVTIYNLYDFLDAKEQKIIDYLNADEVRWSYSVSRIAKSVRGSDNREIECILAHKDLYKRRQSKVANDGTLYSDLTGELETNNSRKTDV